MESIQKHLKQIQQSHGQLSGMEKQKYRDLESLKRRLMSEIEFDVSGLNLIPSKEVDSDTFTKAILLLQQNYGTEYSKEKTGMLFDMIREEKWSEERFNLTLKWFLKNKKYPSWSISDWFDYDIKLYSYGWYLKQVREQGASINNSIEAYTIAENVTGYKLIDGHELPFPKRLLSYRYGG